MARAERGAKSQNKVLDELRRPARRTRHRSGNFDKRCVVGMRRTAPVYFMGSSSVIDAHYKLQQPSELTRRLFGGIFCAPKPHVRCILWNVLPSLDLLPDCEQRLTRVAGILPQDGPSQMAAESLGETQAVNLNTEPGA
jgi:hypothetical protein